MIFILAIVLGFSLELMIARVTHTSFWHMNSGLGFLIGLGSDYVSYRFVRG